MWKRLLVYASGKSVEGNCKKKANFLTAILVKTHVTRLMGWMRLDRNATAGQISPLTSAHDSGWQNIWRREGGEGRERAERPGGGGWGGSRWMTPVEQSR